MYRLASTTPLALATILAAGLALSACKNTVADDVPAEQDASNALDLDSLSPQEQVPHLLPSDTLVVAAYNIEGFRNLRNNSPLPQAVSDALILDLPYVAEILSHGGGAEVYEGIDTSATIYLATSRAGFESSLDSLRIASPDTLASADLGFPDAFHVRAILPVTDAELASSKFNTSYEGLYNVSARGDFLVIDFAAGIISPEIRPWSQSSPITEGLSDASSPAWSAFVSRNAPFALYGQMSGLYDQLALIELGSTLLVPRTPSEESRLQSILALEIAATAQEFSFDSAEVAESEDLAMMLSHGANILTLDAVASLTDYGQTLVDAIAQSAPMRARNVENAAFDMHFGLDLSAAIAQHRAPRWAQDIRGMEQASFQRMIEGQTRDSAWGFPLGVLRSPITGYALFDQFIGPHTTPAEFSMVRGFWLQVLEARDAQLVAGLGLNLPADAPLAPFQDFAKLALTPLGAPVQIETIEHADRLELIASSAAPNDEIFSSEDVEVTPGVDAHVDLRRIAAMLQSVDAPSQVNPTSVMALNALASLGSPNIFAHASFAPGQGLARIQWGGDALVTPTPVSSSRSPKALSAQDACIFTAREWSILGLGEFAALANPPIQTPTLANELAGALDTLANECTSDDATQRVRDLAEDWRAFAQN